MIVHAYEVELLISNPNTKGSRRVTRTEHAYSPFDAFQQALLNQNAHLGTGSADVKLLHVGPPREIVLAADGELARWVDERLTRALRSNHGPIALAMEDIRRARQ